MDRWLRVVVASLGVCCSLISAELRGTVLTARGTPLQRAMVVVRTAGGESLAAEYASADGSFLLKNVPEHGLLQVQFIGAFHEGVTIYGQPEQLGAAPLRARLTAYTYPEALSEVRLSAYGVPAADRRPLVRRADGTWVVEFPFAGKELEVGLSGVEKGGHIPIPGSAEVRRKFNRMVSVVRPVDGTIRIVFDPAKLERSSGGGRSEVQGLRDAASKLNGVIHEIARLEQEQTARRREAYAKGVKSDPIGPAIPEREIEALLRRIDAERDPALRKALLVQYLCLVGPSNQHEQKRVAQSLRELGVASPFWQISYGSAARAAGIAGDAEYLLGILGSLPGAEARVGALRWFLLEAPAHFRERLLEWTKRELSSHPAVPSLLVEYAVAGGIHLGDSVPDFRAHSLQDASVVYSPGTFANRAYLIDFWATWCGPCVSHAPALQSAYARHKSKGFEILSYSLDSSREVVDDFRKHRFPLSWMHAIDPALRAEEGAMARQFGVSGVPRYFLVDRGGKVVAMDLELVGENLERTLERVLK